MNFEIFIQEKAIKQLKKIPKLERQSLIKEIMKLKESPYAPKSRKLQGRKDLRRIRSGDYRVIYRVPDRNGIIAVVKIGHRSDVYRRI